MAEVKDCGHCKFLDGSSTRDFYRKVGPKDESGSRTTIMEVRGICRNKSVKTAGHLVDITSVKDCFQPGQYMAPEKAVKETKKEKTVEVAPTKQEETKKPKKTRTVVSKKVKVEPIVAAKTLSGEVKNLEVKGKCCLKC